MLAEGSRERANLTLEEQKYERLFSYNITGLKSRSRMLRFFFFTNSDNGYSHSGLLDI